MKLKIKSAYVGIFLIGLMFLSTFAFAALQTIYTPSQPNIELPNTNVINYQLGRDQQNLLISQGKTLITYRYDSACVSCLQQKQFLEQLATNSKVSNDLFVQILESNIDPPTVGLVSYSAQIQLTNATNEELFSGLCQVLIKRPLECALQQAP